MLITDIRQATDIHAFLSQTPDAIRAELVRAAEAYYNDDALLSDALYDKVYDAFKAKYPKDQLFLTVGAALKENSVWPKVDHIMPMGSLLKFTEFNELLGWHQNYGARGEICYQEKLDGHSIELVYENGNFLRGSTRGDGQRGDDVTPNILKMRGVPKKIPVDGTVPIRCEALLHYADFQAHFKGGKNPRNSAGGAIRALDGKDAAHLVIYSYDVQLPSLTTEYEKMQLLQSWGFLVPMYGVTKDMNDIEQLFRHAETNRHTLPYEIDGWVLKANSLAHQQELGFVDNRPRAQRAYKFRSVAKEAVIRNVVWQTGRTGAITPVAELEPVDIGGVTISRVSLINIDNISRLALSLGDTVIVSRRNDVIPYVEENKTPKQNTIRIPDACPSCGGSVERVGAFLVCSAPALECPAKSTFTFLNFLTTLSVMGLGDTMVEALQNTGALQKLSDLFQLDVSQFVAAGISPKIGQKVLSDLQLKAQAGVSVPKFYASLGIPGVAEGMVAIIAEKYPTLAAIQKLTVEEMVAIPRIGPKVANALVDYHKHHASVIASLLPHVKVLEEAPAVGDGPLTGKAFCFTGFRSAEAEATIKSLGGKIASGVSKNTTHLVALDIAGSSTKLQKARSLGVKLLTPADLVLLLGEYQ